MRTGGRYLRVGAGAALLVLTACGGGGSSRPVPAPLGAEDPEIRPGGTDPEPSFAGLRRALALAEGVRLSWTRVTREVNQGGKSWREPVSGIEYRVFLAALPDRFDLQNPVLRVQDQEECTLDWLRPGIVQWALVQAWQGQELVGGEGPRLSFMPGPVRYLLPGNSAVARDGSSPERAFANLEEALALSPLPANIWIGPGELAGGRIIPAGISLVGGFDPTFTPEQRDPFRWVTTVVGRAGGAALLTTGGRGHSVFSGLFLDGRKQAVAGIRAVETGLGLRNLTIFGMAGTGLDLRGDSPAESRVTADLAHNRIIGNQGPGLEVTGLASLWGWSSLFRRNGSGGVIAGDLRVNPGGELLFSLRDCEISDNSGVGAELGLKPAPVGSPGGGTAKVHLDLVSSLVRGNEQEGLRIRSSLQSGTPVAGGITIRGCHIAANGTNGMLILPSLDVPALVQGNRLSGNRGPAGITIAGGGGTLRVCNNAVFGNLGSGIRVLAGEGDRLVMIHNNDVAANGMVGLESQAADVTALSNNLVFNAIDADLAWQGYSMRLSGTGGPGVFSDNPLYGRFPVGIQFTQAPGTKELVHVAWSAVTAPGEYVEIADEGRLRQVTQVNRTGIFFSPALPEPAPLGSSVFVWLNETGGDEDIRPDASSKTQGKGSAYLPNAGSSGSHTGITGGPLAVSRTGRAAAMGDPPGGLSTFTFTPPAGTPVEQIDRFTLVAHRPLDPATIDTDTVVLLKAGSLEKIATRVNLFGDKQDRFVVSGFGRLQEPVLLVIRAGVKAADGTPLQAPLIAFFPKE